MIQRQHKSRYYSSEGLRQLQAQINELWEVVDGLLEDAGSHDGFLADRGPGRHDSPVTAAHDPQPATPVSDKNVVVYEVRTTPFPDDPSALDPPLFKVVPTGRGWYQVVDSEGRAIHRVKLRRDAAIRFCDAKLLECR